MSRGCSVAVGVSVALAAVVGFLGMCEVRERTDIEPAKEEFKLLEDDKLSDKNPAFEPTLVDSRCLGSEQEPWDLNASAAVVGLDILDIKAEPDLEKLYPSYAAAAAALTSMGHQVLPSINAVDGKAKQFDDGLYAELDVAFTHEKMKSFHETSALVRSLMGEVKAGGSAHAWLYAALKIGEFVPDGGQEPPGAQSYVTSFDGSALSTPVSFYTWSPELVRTFRFLRFLQSRFNDRAGVPDEIAAVLAKRPELMASYRRLLDFYAHLTNPFDVLSLVHLASQANRGKSLAEIWRGEGLASLPEGPVVQFLPDSGTREKTLFRKLFGARGVPPGVNLMAEFVKAIRSGRVDLRPKEGSGWLDYQVYALETFLLPGRGSESDKLMLSKRYKERLLQAFKALVTKRLETHARQRGFGLLATCALPRAKISPRLRVEPNPTYYLRVARSYTFLLTYLEATLPEGVRKGLKGRTAQGCRKLPLLEELGRMKSLFYGLHLVSCEDIGKRADLVAGEVADLAACKDLAEGWLERWVEDPDLVADTRVCVPLMYDAAHEVTPHWATLGIRGAKLRAWYARAPRWRPGKQGGAWKEIPADKLEDQLCVVLVDEFVELRLPGATALSREGLRKVCDQHGTKEAVRRALGP